MTKEKEEAIKMIEIIVDECKLENKRKGYEGTYYDGDTPIPYKEYEIILNMLKEKDAEIEKYKKLLADNLAKELNNSIKAKEKADTDLDDLNKGWQVELEKYKQLYNKALDDSVITAHDNMKKDKEIQFQKDINKTEKDRHKQAEKSMKGQIKKKDEELKMYKDIKEIANSKVTGLVKLKQYDDFKEENKKKDKMIDLMAEWISERCLYIDNYGNSCEIIQDSCNKRNNCKDCIKQYFERIATNDG